MHETGRSPLSVPWDETTPQDRRSVIRLLLALAAWAVCFAGGSQLIKRGLLPDGPISWGVAALPTIAGVAVILAYIGFLRETDELQRIVQLRALALGFGGTFSAIAGYRDFMRLGAPAADLGDFTLVMAVLYTVGVLVGWSRYR